MTMTVYVVHGFGARRDHGLGNKKCVSAQPMEWPPIFLPTDFTPPSPSSLASAIRVPSTSIQAAMSHTYRQPSWKDTKCPARVARFLSMLQVCPQEKERGL